MVNMKSCRVDYEAFFPLVRDLDEFSFILNVSICSLHLMFYNKASFPYFNWSIEPTKAMVSSELFVEIDDFLQY